MGRNRQLLGIMYFWVALILAMNPTRAGAWPVPDTGQTTSYAVGDDGYYSINPRSYTDNGNGTVTDNVTKLVWQQQDDGQQGAWYDSNNYCEGLSLGGATDWRLPSVQELASIVDHNSKYYPGPLIDPTLFPGTQSSLYWSSTSAAANSSFAVVVNFQTDHIAFGFMTTGGTYARCVRSASENWSDGPIAINNSDTVTNVGTGLSWQRHDNGQEKIWADGLTYCEELALDGFTDWRLPSVNELQSLLINDGSYPAFDTAAFPGTNPSEYWSATTGRNNNQAYAVYVNFDTGVVGGNTKSTSNFVRCVRSGPLNSTVGFLAITSPSQGSTIKDGTMHITWSDPQNIGGQVAISLSREGGKDGTWETITESTENDGAFDWTVAGSESVNCVLKVEPIGNPDKIGYKGLFSIAATQDPTSTTTTTTTTTSTTTTTTTIPVFEQPNSTIRISLTNGDKQDYYTISDMLKLKANYRDQEGFDVDVTGVATWTSTNGLIADVGNGVSKGGTVTFKGNGEIRIFSFLNGLMDYIDFKIGSADIAKHHGNLIILAGGKSNDVKDALKESIQYLCNRFYQVFKVRMFKDEDIFYINHKTDQDFNGDGIPDGIVDQPTKSVQALTQAMQWAKTQANDGPLYLYLVDHGEKNGTFLVDSGQVLSAAQLNALLTDFESTGRPTVVILEACYSGSFVASLAGPHRVILTSANTDKYSYIGAGGKVSFDQFFSNYLMVGKSWEEAFDLTVEDMQSLGLPYSTMMPQKSIGAQVTMGKVYGDFTMASLFPEMKTYTPGASVAAQTAKDFSVQLDVTSTNDVEVWGMVTPPNYQPPTVTEEFGTPVVNLDKIVLTPPEGSKDFMGQYEFPCAGAYSVTYYAKDMNGMVIASPPQTFDVTGDACGFVEKINTSWNLLSLPMTPADPSVESVLGSIKDHLSSAWKWEGGTWAVYLPSLSQAAFASYISSKGFSALATIDAGEGFWLNSDTEQSLNVTGSQPVDTSLSMVNGWNLVGLKADSSQTVASLVAGHETQVASLWKWAGSTWTVNLPGTSDSGKSYAESKGFGHLTTINPGDGFWVNSTTNLTLP